MVIFKAMIPVEDVGFQSQQFIVSHVFSFQFVESMKAFATPAFPSNQQLNKKYVKSSSDSMATTTSPNAPTPHIGGDFMVNWCAILQILDCHCTPVLTRLCTISRYSLLLVLGDFLGIGLTKHAANTFSNINPFAIIESLSVWIYLRLIIKCFPYVVY